MSNLYILVVFIFLMVSNAVVADEFCFAGSDGLKCIDLGAGGGGGCGGSSECGGNNYVGWIPPYLDTHKGLLENPEILKKVYEEHMDVVQK